MKVQPCQCLSGCSEVIINMLTFSWGPTFPCSLFGINQTVKTHLLWLILSYYFRRTLWPEPLWRFEAFVTKFKSIYLRGHVSDAHQTVFFLLQLLCCRSRMMFNKNLICLAFVLDKMLFVTPIGFLLYCLSHGNIEEQIRAQGRMRRRNETVNVPERYAATGWLKMAAVSHYLSGVSLTLHSLGLTLQASRGHKAKCGAINQWIRHKKNTYVPECWL